MIFSILQMGMKLSNLLKFTLVQDQILGLFNCKVPIHI